MEERQKNAQTASRRTSDAEGEGAVRLRPSGALVRDSLGRGLHDLRISVIDRCNYRCTFCMPADREYQFLPREELLSFEEIARVAEAFVALGVSKLRLTGGEPLLRKELPRLVEMLARIEGVQDVALTTNGVLLRKYAQDLAQAGLSRVTVSLESLRDEVYGAINGVGHPVAPILEGIEAAQSAGLQPVKINVVVQRGVNDEEIVELARQLGRRGCVVRFIEFMDVGTLNQWRERDVLSAREILNRVAQQMPLRELPRRHASDTALRYEYVSDQQGGPTAGQEVGAIASITEPFCGDCTRARLSSEGQLYTCLFSSHGFDLKTPVRSGESVDDLRERIAGIWQARADRYSEERRERMLSGVGISEPKVEMYRIGG